MSRKYLALVLVLLVGCNTILPQPPIEVLLPPYTNYEGVMAMEIAFTCPAKDINVVPKPTTLKEGDKCPHCVNGKLTKDGVPTDDCWHCLGDGICNKNDPILTNPGEYVITILGNIVDNLPPIEDWKIPGKKEEAPIPPKPVPVQEMAPKRYVAQTQYHMSWNMRDYTWDEEEDCFIDQLGHKVTFSSILGFHPSKYKNVQMGCSTGRCTLVPITRTTLQVEVTDDQPRATKRPANGAGP